MKDWLNSEPIDKNGNVIETMDEVEVRKMFTKSKFAFFPKWFAFRSAQQAEEEYANAYMVDVGTLVNSAECRIHMGESSTELRFTFIPRISIRFQQRYLDFLPSDNHQLHDLRDQLRGLVEDSVHRAVLHCLYSYRKRQHACVLEGKGGEGFTQSGGV